MEHRKIGWTYYQTHFQKLLFSSAKAGQVLRGRFIRTLVIFLVVEFKHFGKSMLAS